MTPITEISAKALVDNLTIALGNCRQHELKLNALIAAIKQEQPALYRAFAERLEELRSHEDGMQMALAMEKLKTLLQE